MKKCFCEKCGKELDVGDKFCRYCGSNNIKIVDDKPITPPPFEIKDGVLFKCNLEKPVCVKDLKTRAASYDNSLYKLIKQIETDPNSVFWRIVEAYNDFKANCVLKIPTTVKRIANTTSKYNGVFEGLCFYETNISKDIDLDMYALSKCYIHKFTTPKNCSQLCSASIGELKISDFFDYKKPFILYNCFIGRLVIPSSAKRVVLGGKGDEYIAKDVAFQYGSVKELVINSFLTEITTMNDGGLYPGARIETLYYPGTRQDVYDNRIAHIARRIVCKDGAISSRHVKNVGVIGDEYPEETKMMDVKLFANNFCLQNCAHIVQYRGKYTGYIFFDYLCTNQITFQIPDSVTSIRIRRGNGNWVEFKKPYSYKWELNVTNLKSSGSFSDEYDPYHK